MTKSLAFLPRSLVRKKIAFLLILIFALPLCVQASDEIPMKTLSALVARVDEDGSRIEVDFRHPATEKVRRLTFTMDDQSGLSGIKKLQELRAGQVVNIDYVEGSQGRLLIRHLTRVRLSGPPAGLEKFHGF